MVKPRLPPSYDPGLDPGPVFEKEPALLALVLSFTFFKELFAHFAPRDSESGRWPFQRKIDDLDLPIPARSAPAADISVFRRATTMCTGRGLFRVGGDSAHGQPILERWRSIYDVSGIPDAEIRGNDPAHSPVRLDGLVFPGRQPELHPRQLPRHCNDLTEMLEALDIAGIMPPEVSISRAINERAYGFDPARVG